MTPEEFRREGHKAIDWIADYLAHPERFPVLSKVTPGEIADSLPAKGPESGESMEAIFADFEKLILPGITHWNHPGFFAYFAITSSGPGILGELLAAALDSNGILWKSAPALAELEQVTLGWLRDWMGLPATWFGIIHDTASTGTMHALMAARQHAAPETRGMGAPAGLTVYTSEQAHSSVEKGALAIGIGERNVRKIPVDDAFRMLPGALEARIEEDLAAGVQPACVVASAGTTGTTSIDPIAGIAAICKRHRIWLHVDAAYGGSAAIVPELRFVLEGAELADSLVVNPHKWLFVPVDLSVLFTRRPEAFRDTFSLVPPYLRQAAHPRALNYMEYAVPLGRRFRALKLWFVMRYYGHQRLAELIRGHVAMAHEFAAWVDADPQFERVAPVPLSLVVFRFRGTDEQNRRVIDAVNASGEVFLDGSVLRGRQVIRLAVGNMGTSREHLLRVWQLLKEQAAVL